MGCSANLYIFVVRGHSRVYNGSNSVRGFFPWPSNRYRSASHLSTNCLSSNCLCLRLNWISPETRRVWIGSEASDCTNSVALKAHSHSGSESEDFLWYDMFTARKRSLRRICFYTCLSFCSQGGLHPGGLGRTPPPNRRILQDTVNERVVRMILLDCSLNFFRFRHRCRIV